MSTEVILFLVVAAALGGVIGWLIASRPVAALRVHAEQAEALRQALREAAEERELVGARHATLVAEKAALVAEHMARSEAFEAQLRQLAEAKDALSAQFAETAGQLLESAQRQFLERADARFKQAEETNGQGLKALLQPVHERLERYEEAVGKVEAERREAFGVLHGQIDMMRQGTERVSSEAAKLVNALRNAPKARGRWGEQQLRNVLESCGLSEHADFQTEVSTPVEDGGRMRPDVIVRVPGGKALVIDAKVSLNAYQDAFGAIDDDERRRHLDLHAASMKAHVNSLGNKAYWNQFDDAPDYVIMFIPGEHFLAAALDHEPTLWDQAFDRRVLLATPTNLIAILRTVAAVWRQERLAKDARQIGELGKELYDRLAKAAGDLRKVGSGLTSAVNNYNSFVSSFESRTLVSARKLRDMNIEPSTREIEDVPPVEVLARYGMDDVVVPLLKSSATD